MTENEFYVAIQGVMTEAQRQGWDIDRVHEMVTDAADEWLGENETDAFDDETD